VVVHRNYRELADLLGQVKTSTVSKEEIEKSGLEVIKASLLPQYFREDKITANCLERVGLLIQVGSFGSEFLFLPVPCLS